MQVKERICKGLYGEGRKTSCKNPFSKVLSLIKVGLVKKTGAPFLEMRTKPQVCKVNLGRDTGREFWVVMGLSSSRDILFSKKSHSWSSSTY